MKKKVAVFLSILLIFLLVACGGGTKQETKTETAVKTEEKPEESEKPEIAEESKEDINYTETKFWKAELPDGWITEDNDDKDTYIEQSYSKDDEVINIKVNVEEKLNRFRGTIRKATGDLKKYVEKTAENGVYLGDLYAIKGNQIGSNGLQLWARDEGRNTNVIISYSGDESDEMFKRFLETFELKTEDIGHKDPPYPWEGERFEPKLGEANVGSYKISSEYLKFEEFYDNYDIYGMDSTRFGDYIYVVLKNNLRIYKIDGDILKLEKEVELPNDYEKIQAGANGRVYISNFMKNFLVYEGLEQTLTTDVKNKVAVAPNGEWVIEFFMDPLALKKTTINADGSINTTEFKLVGADGNPVQKSVDIFILGDKIAAAGQSVSDQKHVVCLYDLNGVFLQELRDHDGSGFGSIKGVIEGKNGYLAADLNLREFHVWNKAGEYIGKVEDGELFGTDYPWISDMKRAPNGDIYVTLSDERADKSAVEILIFKLSTDL